jgi:hypothetical protein
VKGSREYFFVLTLQGSGGTPGTVNGVARTTRAGITRQEMYGDIYRDACKELGLQSAVTLFFSLEPNDL